MSETVFEPGSIPVAPTNTGQQLASKQFNPLTRLLIPGSPITGFMHQSTGEVFLSCDGIVRLHMHRSDAIAVRDWLTAAIGDGP